jgi:magnesium transporter
MTYSADAHEAEVHASTSFAAASLMSKRVPRSSKHDRADSIRREIIGGSFDTVAEIAVLDGDRLVGLINIESLLAADDHVVASDLMDSDPPVVRSGVDQEIAAWRATQRGQSALAVVDSEGRFLGLIPPQRLLRVLLEEHE